MSTQTWQRKNFAMKTRDRKTARKHRKWPDEPFSERRFLSGWLEGGRKEEVLCSHMCGPLFTHVFGPSFAHVWPFVHTDAPFVHTACVANSPMQYGGFVEQIECGARAFDIRPYVKADGSLIFHHGTALCDYPLKDALQEVVDWTTSNPDELVVLSEFSCWSEEGGGDCMDLYKGVLNDLNIYRASSSELMTTIPSSEVDGSDEVAAITVAAAMELASADNPGVNMPLALSSSNIDGTYDTFDYLGECYEMTTLGDYVDFESLLLAEDSSWKPGDKATDFDPAALNKVVNEVTRAVGSIPVGTSCYGSGQNEARRKQREIWDSMAKMGPSEIMKGGARIDPGGNINPTKTHTKPNKPFWKVDGHWQYSTESIVSCAIHMCEERGAAV